MLGHDVKDGPKGGGMDMPSAPSTINSLKSKHTDSFASSIKMRHDFRDQINTLRSENNRLDKRRNILRMIKATIKKRQSNVKIESHT